MRAINYSKNCKRQRAASIETLARAGGSTCVSIETIKRRRQHSLSHMEEISRLEGNVKFSSVLSLFVLIHAIRFKWLTTRARHRERKIPLVSGRNMLSAPPVTVQTQRVPETHSSWMGCWAEPRRAALSPGDSSLISTIKALGKTCGMSWGWRTPFTSQHLQTARSPTRMICKRY